MLGPPQSPALFDEFLPKDMPMSCINRTVGNTPVEPGFAKITGRPKWAIPWLEDDPGMTIPQLWAGRMRRDAADALKYGCTGLMGIHWRTRILAPNVSALAKAAWDQTGWNDDAKNVADGPSAKCPRASKAVKLAQFPDNSHSPAPTTTPSIRTVRYGMKAYHIDVPNGTYNVTLKLCEPAYAEKGKRVFGAKVQDKTLFEHLDIFAKVGKNHALDKTANDVQVTDGRLTIEFIAETEFPCIAGIVIEGKTAGLEPVPRQPYTRKINCGGPVFQGLPGRSGADRRRRQAALSCRWPISMPIGPARSLARRRPNRSPRFSPGSTAICRVRPIGSPAPAAFAPTASLGSGAEGVCLRR